MDYYKQLRILLIIFDFHFSGIYLLCYVVVDSDNSDNWAWFVVKLVDFLNL